MSTVAPLRFLFPSPPRDMAPDDEASILDSRYHDVSMFDVTRGNPVDAPQNSALPTVEEIRPDDTPAAFPAFPDGTFVDNGMASDALNSLSQWPDLPYRLPPISFISPGVYDPGYYHAEPNFDKRPLSRASHATDFPFASPSNDQNVTEPCTSPHLPSHPSSGPSLPSSLPHLESLGSAPRLCVVPPQDSTALSRRRQGARAIHYGGIWLDERELLTALKESNRNLHVFRCCLEEDHSPCHLWIKGEKSSIKAHMRKWHGDRPGGDKSEVDCRWSNCARKMLKESVARHIVRIHLGEMWECLGCQKKTTRYDVHNRHTLTSDIEACRTSGALTTYSVDVVVVDAQVALDSGGWNRGTQVRDVDAY